MTIKDGLSLLGDIAINQAKKANESRRWSLVLAVFFIQVLEIALKMGDAVIIAWTGVCGIVVGFFFAKHEPVVNSTTNVVANDTVSMGGGK